jgi:hypothetical protein
LVAGETAEATIVRGRSVEYGGRCTRVGLEQRLSRVVRGDFGGGNGETGF